ncbi:MAG: hypothetical protein WBV46_06750, partial [Terriglobales bacterium]
MKKATRRFVLAIAATLVLVLSCYGLARAYLYYEAARAGRMLKALGDAGPSVGWAYLVSVIDCCTREIVGWDLSLRCRTDEALAALNHA